MGTLHCSGARSPCRAHHAGVLLLSASPGGLFLTCLSLTGTELRVSISPQSGAWVSCSSTSSHRSADEGRAVHLLIFQVGEEPSVTWVQREVTARGKVSGFTKPVLSLYCLV